MGDPTAKKKEKGKKFSVDEFLKGYEKRKPKRESIEGMLERRRGEVEAEHEAVRRLPGEEEMEKYERLPKAEEVFEEKGKLMVGHKGVILGAYFLRALAISVMALLMLFVFLNRVMQKRPFAGFRSVGDSFIEFLLEQLVLFIGLLLVLFGLQLSYYIFYWVANKKWKRYERQEIVVTIAIALAGILGSALILWGFNYF